MKRDRKRETRALLLELGERATSELDAEYLCAQGAIVLRGRKASPRRLLGRRWTLTIEENDIVTRDTWIATHFYENLNELAFKRDATRGPLFKDTAFFDVSDITWKE